MTEHLTQLCVCGEINMRHCPVHGNALTVSQFPRPEMQEIGKPPTLDPCPCCGHEREYADSNYWYCRRRPSWFWRRAARVACAIFGCKLNCDYGDCYRCG